MNIDLSRSVRERFLSDSIRPTTKSCWSPTSTQTGFDQPLLHTMYVDKQLDGRAGALPSSANA